MIPVERRERVRQYALRVSRATRLDTLLAICDQIRAEWRPDEMMDAAGLRLYAAIEKRRGELGDPQFVG